MKQLFTTAGVLFSMTAFAQVGINNTSPKATLDITAKTSGTKPEGLIIPQLTGDQIHTATITASPAVYNTTHKGLIIYATSADSSPTGATANITAPGYYYFDGSVWQKILGSTSGDTTNDAWINDTTNSMVKIGTKADGTARAAGTDFVVKDDGKVGIGTSSPTVNLDVIGSEMRLRGGDNPVLRIHSAANEANKGGSIEFNEDNTNWGMRIRHSTASATGSVEGLFIETKSSGAYSPILALDQSNKYVGIGTTNPQASLHLLNSARFELPHRMTDRVLKSKTDNGDLYWAPANTNYGAGVLTTTASVANGASTTYTFTNTKGMVRINVGNACGRYWQKDFDFNTENSTIAFIVGSGVGDPDGGGSETMTSNSSYSLTGSMVACVDQSFGGLPATISISGNTLTITNNTNVAKTFKITEFPYLSPTVNLYTENGSLGSNRTVAQGTNTLAFTSTATAGTSHFTVDGTTLNVDAVNNRVGVGTATPMAPVHISGALAGGDHLRMTNTGSDWSLASENAGAQNGISGQSSLTINNRTGNFRAMTIGTDNSFRLGGNLSVGNAAFSIDGATNKIGIGINVPNATLDVRAASNGSTPEGIIAPRLSLTALQGYAYGTNQTGAMVYVNSVSGTPAGQTANVTAVGYYYFDGSNWQKVANGASVTDATTTAKGIVQLAGDLSGTAASPSIATSAVTSAKIADGTVANADLNSGVGGIYKGSGSLAGNTTVTQGTNTLAFSSSATNGFSVAGSTLSVDGANSRVGIGTTTPNATLDVRTNPTSTTDPGTGMLGLGTTTATAAAAGAGAMRYNTSSKNLQYSDGSNWSSLAKTDTYGSFIPVVKLVARKLSNQTVSDNTYSTVTFPTVVSNPDGGYNAATGIYTVPAGESGLYMVSSAYQVTFNNFNNASDIRVNFNGNDIVVYTLNNWQASGASIGGSVSYYLTAGQTIKITSQTCTGCSANSYTYNSGVFSITKLSAN